MIWLTTSKNADAVLKGIAQKLASALPMCKYVGRGARALSRIDRLAQRDGITTYLVLGRSNIGGEPMLLSRHYVDDGDTCVWMWHHRRMEKFEAKCAKLEEPDEPYEFVWGGGEENDFLSEFLGYEAGKTDELFERSTEVSLGVKKGGANMKVGKKLAVEFKFKWKNLDGSEE